MTFRLSAGRNKHAALRFGRVKNCFEAAGAAQTIASVGGHAARSECSFRIQRQVANLAAILTRANADVVAVHPTVTLHLPRGEFLGLVRDHPAILSGLYLAAVERDEETTSVLGSSTTSVAEDFVLI